MRRMFCTLTFVVALLLFATACSGSRPEGEGGAEGGELVWAVGGPEAAPGGVQHDTVAAWNEAHPDTPVRIEVLPDDADQQRQQISLELNAQESNFDILALDVIWTGEFSENGWLENLEDIRDQVEERTLAGPFESATWGGELWAVPYNSNAGFLYYRSDLVPEPPTTWDELVRVGTEVAQGAGMAPFVGQGAQYEGLIVNYLEYFWGAGGELFNEDQSEVLYGEGDAGQRSLEFMREAQESGFYAPGFNTMREEEARNEFQSGKAVFMRNWPYAYGLMSDEAQSAVAGKFDIAPLPTFDGSGTISALGGFNLGVSAFSDNKEAAKAFVLFAATDPDVQRRLGETSLPPVLESAYEELQDDPVMALLAKVLADAKPRPPAPGWNQISEEMQRAVFAAYNGQQEVGPAVEAITSTLDEHVRAAS